MVIYRRNHGTTGPRDDGTTGSRRSYQCKFRVVTDVYARDCPPKSDSPLDSKCMKTRKDVGAVVGAGEGAGVRRKGYFSRY